MRSFLTRNWKILTPIGAVLAAVGIYLFFFVFALHLALVDDKVDEAGPTFDSGAGAVVEVTAAEDAPPDDIDETAEAPPEDTDEMAEETADGAVEDEPELEITTLVSGSFVDRSHPSSGTASVLTDGSTQRFVRFEDFETDNGPDLNVYLSTAAADAPVGDFDDDFVDLGDLKGNIGSQNYELPVDVDLDRYTTVVIWCVRFGVAFGAADLG
jgi:hypothetical protein